MTQVHRNDLHHLLHLQMGPRGLAARLVSQQEGTAAVPPTQARNYQSGVMRCNNCPSRGCSQCPMFGVGQNPVYLKRLALREERKKASGPRVPSAVEEAVRAYIENNVPDEATLEVIRSSLDGPGRVLFVGSARNTEAEAGSGDDGAVGGDAQVLRVAVRRRRLQPLLARVPRVPRHDAGGRVPVRQHADDRRLQPRAVDGPRPRLGGGRVGLPGRQGVGVVHRAGDGDEGRRDVRARRLEPRLGVLCRPALLLAGDGAQQRPALVAPRRRRRLARRRRALAHRERRGAPSESASRDPVSDAGIRRRADLDLPRIGQPAWQRSHGADHVFFITFKDRITRSRGIALGVRNASFDVSANAIFALISNRAEISAMKQDFFVFCTNAPRRFWLGPSRHPIDKLAGISDHRTVVGHKHGLLIVVLR